jgi:hypothetical protein
MHIPGHVCREKISNIGPEQETVPVAAGASEAAGRKRTDILIKVANLDFAGY